VRGAGKLGWKQGLGYEACPENEKPAVSGRNNKMPSIFSVPGGALLGAWFREEPGL